MKSGNVQFWADEGADGTIPQSGLKLWLAASDLQLSAWDRIQQWLDKSGNNNHATQETALIRPTYRTFGQNGQPYVYFRRESSPSVLGHNLTLPDFCSSFTEGEIYLVMTEDVLGGDVTVSLGGNTNRLYHMGGGTDGTHWPSDTGNIEEGFGCAALVDTTYTLPTNPNPWHIHNAARTATNLTVRLDNSSIYSANPGVAVQFATAPILGGDGDPSHDWAGGGISEVIMYNRVLTAAERTQVIQYLSDKFAFGLLAPASSPNWDPAWTDDEATEARQNRGYWHEQDADGKEAEMVDITDPRSHHAGRWW